MNIKNNIWLKITIVVILAIVAVVFLNTTDNEHTTNANITINVFDKANSNIYSNNITTEEKYLLEAVSNISELKLKKEEGQYGAYITSILEIEQGDDYYWSYYVDDEYATTGVSNCKIEDGKTYDFKIEKFQY